MMKLLATLGYLVFEGLGSWLVYQMITKITGSLRKLEIPRISGAPTILSLLALLSHFAAYASLAWTFPTYLIVLLVAVRLLGYALYGLVGAVTGFDLPERRQKISALSLEFLNLRSTIALNIARTIVVLGAMIGSLWVFWTHPPGSVEARAEIALFHFTLPALMDTAFTVLSIIPQVTAGYLDDDFRNFSLIGIFNNICEDTVYLVYPAWIFSEGKGPGIGHFGISLPPFWLLVSLPFLTYLFGCILPFFLGIFRFRMQAKVFSGWRLKWLTEAVEFLKLPVGRARTESLAGLMKRMNVEMEHRMGENSLLSMYYQLEVEDRRAHSQLAARQVEPAEPKALAAPAVGNTSTEVDLADMSTAILMKNRSNLPDWDLRFNHLDRLLHYSRLMQSADTEDVAAALELTLKHAGEEDKDTSAQ